MFNRLTEKPYSSLSIRVHSQMTNYHQLLFQGIRGPVVEPEPGSEPEPTLKKSRFKKKCQVEHIDMLTGARLKETTMQQTDWEVRLFRGWLTENQYNILYNDKFEELESSILNDRLSFFLPEPETKKGPDYSKSALVGILSTCSNIPSSHTAIALSKTKLSVCSSSHGKNKLSQIMPRNSNEAGLSYRYTNHCRKAAVGTWLKSVGVDD
ncbi:unnamed protein product [Mytilus edulis]|uniref:Uncharacterized protein n=1 Tax=Mytilus edulis TaxID=6550 RepID=A0A8S3U185_MYTED|nr:unnamed protein product [Mytilus edulis]